MKKSSTFLVLFILFSFFPLRAQLTIAIADFKNNTYTFYLDDWEKSIPEFLKSELSKSENLVIVEGASSEYDRSCR